jgi:glycosyltransferase involved in cell wall biosynthesis
LKVTHFSTYDTAGGAGRAALRLHEALKSEGVDSRLVVLRRTGTDDSCRRVLPSNWRNEARLEIAAGLNNAIKYRYRPDEAFSFDLDMLSAPTDALVKQANGSAVINLHWTRELVTSRQALAMSRATGAPIVMTLMDLAALTGGCHYTLGCVRFRERCGLCPRLRSHREHDLSRRTWKRRRRDYSSTPLTLVACNTWTRDRVRESSLLADARCDIIPLPIDTDLFRPIPKPMARQVLDVAQDARVIFCGALQMGQSRKGEAQLLDSLGRLHELLPTDVERDRLLVLTAGTRNLATDPSFPLRVKHLGLLGDDRSLALAYCAADVFVSASLEDAGPMMINESLACGTPVAAFDVGAAGDFVRHRETGALAIPGDTISLSRGIGDVLFSDDAESCSARCRKLAVEEYSPTTVARRYLDLYQELAETGPKR